MVSCRFAATALTLSCSLALFGCGSGKQDTAKGATPPAATAALPNAKDLLQKTRESTMKAKSLRLKGEVALKHKLTVIDSAGDTQGSFTRTELSADGSQVTVLVVDRSAYVKANKGFLSAEGRLSSAQVDAYANKWVKYKASEQPSLTTKGILDTLFDKGLNNDARSRKDTLDGKPVLVAEDAEYRWFIAADGTDRPVKVESLVEKGTLAFSDWDGFTAPSEPAANQVLAPPVTVPSGATTTVKDEAKPTTTVKGEGKPTTTVKGEAKPTTTR